MDEELQRPERVELMHAVRGSLLAMAAALGLAATPLVVTPCLADPPPASNPHNVQEPAGLHHGDMHGYVPTTLKGGTVVDTAALDKLIKDSHPILIDVAETDRKPPTMSKDMIWLPQHRSLPGTIWMPGAGNGTDDPGFAAAFSARAAALTGGNKMTPIVVFCHPDCWASYNAAKRLVGLGYKNVYWYPQGMEGWQEDHDTSVIKPDSTWEGSLPKALTQ